MLKSIEVKNFQSHARTKLNLDPGINVIAGPSDVGKSAIIRAIRWVNDNRPTGDSFRSWFSDKETTISIQTDGGHEVKRIRGKSVNKYMVNGEEIKAVGNGPAPDEVKATLNLHPINFQFQHDSPFLLTSSAGEVSQVLNKAAQLDVIDRTVSALRSRILKNNRDLQAVEQVIDETNEELNSLPDLDRARELVNQIELLIQDQIEPIKNQIQTLETAIIRMNRAEDARDQAEKISSKVDSLEEILALSEQIDQEIQRGKLLGRLVRDSEELNKTIHKADTLLEFRDQVDELESQLDTISLSKARMKQLSSLYQGAIDCNEDIEEISSELKKLQQKWEEIKPDICPTCGQEWK